MSLRVGVRLVIACGVLVEAAAGGPSAASGSNSLPRPPSPPAGPQEPPTFRSGVRLVNVDVSVTDASGDFVCGFVKDDFEILEDGRPQQVAMFSFVDLPMAASPAPADLAGAVEPGVSTTRTADGRSSVVLLDSPSTARAGGGASSDLLVRRVARQFVEQSVGPGGTRRGSPRRGDDRSRPGRLGPSCATTARTPVPASSMTSAPS